MTSTYQFHVHLLTKRNKEHSWKFTRSQDAFWKIAPSPMIFAIGSRFAGWGGFASNLGSWEETQFKPCNEIYILWLNGYTVAINFPIFERVPQIHYRRYSVITSPIRFWIGSGSGPPPPPEGTAKRGPGGPGKPGGPATPGSPFSPESPLGP